MDITKPAEVQLTHPTSYGTLPLTEELKEQAKKALLDRIESVKVDREKRFKEYKEIDKLYTTETSGDKDTLANVMTPDGFNSVEDWVALEVDAMFPTDPWFDLKGSRTPLDALKKAKIVQVLQRNNRRTSFELEHEDVMRQGAKYGTLVAKCVYQVEEEDAVRLTQQPKMVGDVAVRDENGQPVTEPVIEQYVDDEDYTKYQYVPLENLYFRKDKLNWVIEKINSSWSYIDRNKDLFDNLDKARKTTHTNDCKVDDDVELYEGHMIPLKIEDKQVLCLIVMVNREEVIRVIPYPYKKLAYLFTQFFKQAGVEGRGVIDLLKKMLMEVNTRRTQALDANTHGLYGMKAVNMRYIKKPEQLRIRKDGLIELKETDKPIDQIISFFRPPVEYANVAMGLLDRIALDMTKTTRLKGVLAGEKISPNPSVSEFQGMMKEALKSVKVILRRIARTQIEEYLERTYMNGIMNRQKSWKIPTKRMVQVPGQPLPDGTPGQPIIQEVDDFETISPMEILTDGLDIEALGVTYMTDEITMRHQLMQKLDILVKYAQLPLVNEQGQNVQPDYYKQMKRLMVSFNDMKPEENFRPIPPPPPPPPPKEEKPKISYSFKAEDLMNPLVQAILLETAKDDGVLPPPPQVPIGPEGPNNPHNMMPKNLSMNMDQQITPEPGNLAMAANNG